MRRGLPVSELREQPWKALGRKVVFGAQGLQSGLVDIRGDSSEPPLEEELKAAYMSSMVRGVSGFRA